MSYNPNNPNGQQNMANSQPVTIANNQSTVPVVDSAVTTAIGTTNTAIGAPADAAASTDTGTFSEIALHKRELSQMVKAVDVDNAPLTNTKPGIIGGKAIDVTNPTAFTIGDAVTDVHDNATGAKVVLQGDLDPRYDKVTISDKSITSFVEITRPADTTAYAINDAIYSSASVSGNIQFTGVSLGTSSTYDGGGYITALKFRSDEVVLIGKRLTLLLYGSGTTIGLLDNTGIVESYAAVKSRICRIDIDNIIATIGSSAAVECELLNLRIPFKVTGTLFNAALVTRDTYTPASAKKYYIELTITGNQ